MTRDEFSEKLKRGNYDDDFKAFLEKATLNYFENRFPFIRGKFQFKIEGTIGKFERIEL